MNFIGAFALQWLNDMEELQADLGRTQAGGRRRISAREPVPGRRDVAPTEARIVLPRQLRRLDRDGVSREDGAAVSPGSTGPLPTPHVHRP